jgi:hypothetical protein
MLHPDGESALRCRRVRERIIKAVALARVSRIVDAKLRM